MAGGPSARGPDSLREGGFSALELLVIVVIVSAVVALGVPTLRAKAHDSVLDMNMRSLASLVQQEMLAGYDSSYQPAGEGSSERYLSTHLETILRASGSKGGYSNAYADGERAYAILNSRSLPTDPLTALPAVYISDNAECRYEVFDSQPYEPSRRYLVGSLVIHFNTAAKTVDIFYVDGKGNTSAEVVRVPTA